MKVTKLQVTSRYVFALVILIAGIILGALDIGKEFLGFSSIGTWLIYVGFIMLTVITLQLLKNKKRIVDERMRLIAYKASRITFVLMILAAFIIMIIDGINAITIPYSMFMSYIIAYMIFVYFISYKILERFN